MEQTQQNYRSYLINWCDTVYQNSQQLKESLNFPSEEKEQEWGNKIQQFKRSLEEESRDETLDDLYQTAQNLYDEWELLLNPSPSREEREEKLPETDNEDQQLRGENSGTKVGIGKHKLPPLPYAYNALEPYISEEIMRLHHLKHHQKYVDGLNEAERQMLQARKKNDYKLITHWEREAAFNGAGHYLHTIFWEIMSPKGGGVPSGKIKQAIDESFGSFEKFKKHFSEAAKNVEGAGWAILVWSPRAHRLEILQAEKHQNLSQWDVVPLLVLDVWEHAYYLQYKNNRDQYVDNWWNVVNWDAVDCRYREAEKLRWKPY